MHHNVRDSLRVAAAIQVSTSIATDSTWLCAFSFRKDGGTHRTLYVQVWCLHSHLPAFPNDTQRWIVGVVVCDLYCAARLHNVFTSHMLLPTRVHKPIYFWKLNSVWPIHVVEILRVLGQSTLMFQVPLSAHEDHSQFQLTLVKMPFCLIC